MVQRFFQDLLSKLSLKTNTSLGCMSLRRPFPFGIAKVPAEIIYVHDTGGLGETAVVNFNAGQEVETMLGSSVLQLPW